MQVDAIRSDSRKSSRGKFESDRFSSMADGVARSPAIWDVAPSHSSAL